MYDPWSQPDASVLQQVSSSTLMRLLDKIHGPKTLVLSPSLAGPLGLITDVGSLKNNHGVTKLYWLESDPLTSAERNIVFLCTSQVKWMRMIAGHVQASGSHGAKSHHLLIVPRMTPLCSQVLEDSGVLGALDIQEYPMGLVPIDRDLLSLEQDDAYRRLNLERDLAPVYDMAQAVMTIQRAFGAIPRIIGKGTSARRMVNVLKQLRIEQSTTSLAATPFATGAVDSLIVLDRAVDMVSPLCTQLTYEGLIDEVIGIHNSHVDVDPNLVNPPPAASTSSPTTASSGAQPARKKKHLLSSRDSLFASLRDRNFAVVGSILNRTARRLNDDYEKRHQAKTPAELRQFVGQLGELQSEHQSLRLHTGLTEQIMAITSSDEFNIALEIQQNLVAGVDVAKQEQAIHNLINQEAPMRTVLRLLCIYSIVCGGLKPKLLEELKRDFLQELELLSRATSAKSAFAQARKPLRLIVDDVDEQNPKDISYVFSGYAPLSVRLIQCALGRNSGAGNDAPPGSALNGWHGIEDVLKTLPGEAFEEAQVPDWSSRSAASGISTTAVCFLGGVTYAEIAALRLLNRQTPARNLLILTTGCVQGSSLITSLMAEGSR
ncbi:Vacuolar protein-sorting-associated protein 33 [Microbotryomycetes sp. JL221]|nr:Vacuolar protein-sorting-associated protein 33 [Microbotryomycetes sp. JL221]